MIRPHPRVGQCPQKLTLYVGQVQGTLSRPVWQAGWWPTRGQKGACVRSAVVNRAACVSIDGQLHSPTFCDLTCCFIWRIQKTQQAKHLKQVLGHIVSYNSENMISIKREMQTLHTRRERRRRWTHTKLHRKYVFMDEKCSRCCSA